MGNYRRVAVMADKNNNSDGDIKKARASVLRAKDIIPPFDRPADRAKSQPPIPIEAIETAPANINRPPAEPRPGAVAEPDGRDIPLEDIPEFDLAEQIMARHRRQTAIKRKSPAEKTEINSVPLRTEGPAGQKTILSPAKYDRIIADIVARDIEKFCRG